MFIEMIGEAVEIGGVVEGERREGIEFLCFWI